MRERREELLLLHTRDSPNRAGAASLGPIKIAALSAVGDQGSAPRGTQCSHEELRLRHLNARLGDLVRYPRQFAGLPQASTCVAVEQGK